MDKQSPATDFREFIQHLKAHGELIDIHEHVDPDLEVGAITRRVYETRAPAPMFNRLQTGDPGLRILGAPAGMSRKKGQEYIRLAAHFNLPASAQPAEILNAIIMAKQKPAIAPIRLNDAPCKQNKMIGDDVDLTRFPVPLLHQEDGGRYFGTYGFHVVQSPDGTWDSWSVGRTMLHNRNTLVGPAMSMQHIGMIHAMWAKEGKRTPWAMVLGAPPAAMAVAGMPLPAWVSEPDYVGTLTHQPVPVIKCETNPLYVPAFSEIVVEGEISFDELQMEGPMGEYHGYSFDEGKPQPVFHVRAITWRDNAILPICVAGIPPEENHTIWGTMMAAEALAQCQKDGLPVDMAWCTYEAASCWLVLSVDINELAKMETTANDFVELIADTFFKSHVAWLIPKVILVANDIDITNVEQVVWALATRSHPKRDYHIYSQKPGIPMVPYLDDEDKENEHGGKMIINCLFPEEFRGKPRARKACFNDSYPDDIKQQVIEKWQQYGY